MKKIFPLLLLSATVQAQNRFPKPDFESGYNYPDFNYFVPNETLWNVIDVVLLVIMMSIVAYAVVYRRKRAPVFIVSIISILYFGFYRSGCVCSIGAIQNVALALTDSSYSMPVFVFLVFILPIIFTFFFGRVFCAGVCPFGALQELVNVRNFRLSKALSSVLSIIPWIYLIFALLYAVTRSSFIICRFDPFIGIFRMGGDFGVIAFGGLLLLASVFTGRPFCRFLCPYGALLSLFSHVSLKHLTITPNCINCDLCRNACPVDAIRPPYENKVKESRMAGVKRLFAYLVFLPLMGLAGALFLRLASDSLSEANKEVRLHELVMQNETNPQDIQPVDVEVFFAQGGTIEELSSRVVEIRKQFTVYSTVAGALMGLIIGITLINLSLKRTRKSYEIDNAACINCGRCFNYCPQNQLTNKKE
ncbi:MAG: 4Fe-4S binding protein [Bacteroidales bacterium]|jgi:Fe-S-cluster-containing hydrogenase component 2|nr:4Fe-4S binding protein [Bacteroidales bacterium]